ncbi:LysR family transcriptional regulator [Marinobacterium arenosum]|uniref:LysR family transcriptional regulator n=1 Tax=Marinobacterium arenosum TaxID=2862496 RepID=UPI001C937E7A|nr:LysR substrate-binding domain-containing protein [Marinobacterium arenosum]MBY4675607.1 LysR family transcriptional regulator [Marinobacterium arenosum]
MNTDLLRTFIVVVDTGSYNRAAQQLYRTPSAISMQMKRLEEQVGKPLFEQQGRERVLTRHGKQLVGYARRILSLQQEALSVLEAGAGQEPLRLGCPDDYAQGLLTDLLELIWQQAPELQVQVVSGASTQLRHQLDMGELDLALVTRRPDSDEGFLLRQDQGVWLAAADFDWSAADPLPLALYPPDCKFMNGALDGLEKQGRRYQLKTISVGCGILLELVRRGIAITAMARISAPADLVVAPAEQQLPELPAIEIVLLVGAQQHPFFNSHRLQALAEVVNAGTT